MFVILDPYIYIFISFYFRKGEKNDRDDFFFLYEMWMNDIGTKLQKHSSLPVRNDGEGRAVGGTPLPAALCPAYTRQDS